MSKKKQTPAEVAQELAKFIAKQEETLSKYPVGPLANTARRNLQKGQRALQALQSKNESMRMAMEGNAAPQPTMALGGATMPAELSAAISAETGLTQGQLDMLNYLKTEAGYSDAVALAAVSVTSKESGGDSMAVENSYANTSASAIRGINSRFKKAFADKDDAFIDNLKKDPEAFFNYVYKDATGNSEEGDGYKYRGRGLIQLTGKANYRDASQALFGDDTLVENPDLLLDQKIAGQVAGWFTSSRGKGVKGYLDFDPSEPNPSPEQLQQVMNGAYATIATGGTLPKSKATTEYLSENYNQYGKSMPKMQNFTAQVLPAVTSSQAYQEYQAAPQSTDPPPATQQAAAQQPGASSNLRPELNDDILYDLASKDAGMKEFLEKNDLTMADLKNRIGGGYLDNKNRAALDQRIRNIASTYQQERQQEVSGPAPSKEKDQRGSDTYGWSESLGISRDRYMELRNQGIEKYGDQALAYIPGEGGKEGEFKPGATMLPSADVATELPRDPVTGRPQFTGMRQANNYWANLNLKESGVRAMEDMRGGIHETTGNFARNYLQPTLLGTLGATSLPALANLSTGLAASGEVGAALNTVGGQFLRGLAGNPYTNTLAGSSLTAPGLLGAGTTAYQTSSGLARLTGDYGLTDRQNAYQVAMNPDMSNLQKAEYFATLGIELAPTVFNSPTAIKNIFRGSPSDFPGSYSSFLRARRGLINSADETADLANLTDDAFRATQTNRAAFKNSAAKAEQSAVAAETRAAANPTKANQKAATTARNKATKAKANDDAALKAQQADNARRLNARGRAQVAQEELGTFRQRYDAPRQPYQFGPTLANTNNQVPNIGPLPGIMYDLNQMGQRPEVTASVDPRAVQVQPQFVEPVEGRTEQVAEPTPTPTPTTPPPAGGGSGGGGTPGTETPDYNTNVDPETTVPDQVTADPVKSDVEVGAPDMVSMEMPKMNYLQAIPAMASLASAGIQRRALNQMQGPAAPVMSDIPAFAYQSNVAQSLQDVRNATEAAGRLENLSPQQRAAYRQNLLGQRFRQEQGIRAQDNQARQAAKARYDTMAYQARAAQDALRNQYTNDVNAYNNQKAMLEAQIKQQPLQVLSASTQDYLKNVYAPNIAAQLEGIGRQFNTQFPSLQDPNQNT